MKPTLEELKQFPTIKHLYNYNVGWFRITSTVVLFVVWLLLAIWLKNNTLIFIGFYGFFASFVILCLLILVEFLFKTLGIFGKPTDFVVLAILREHPLDTHLRSHTRDTDIVLYDVESKLVRTWFYTEELSNDYDGPGLGEVRVALKNCKSGKIFVIKQHFITYQEYTRLLEKQNILVAKVLWSWASVA